MTKYVYDFSEGNKDMKDLLGGKGANLAEMTNMGLPVPPGFTITTEACLIFLANEGAPPEMLQEAGEHLVHLQETMGRNLGDPDDPLLVSVRSGAKFSMPGMMDTVLNLGLNDASVQGLAKQTGGDMRFANDAYRRFIQMFGKIVMDVPGEAFEHALDEAKERKGPGTQDTDLDVDDLAELIERFQAIYQEHTGEAFPQDPKDQLRLAIDAVFSSWNGKRAIDYRRQNKISDDLGHRGEHPGDGVRQPGRRLGHRRGVHARPRDRREGAVRRLPLERAGRGRRRRHPQHAAHRGAGAAGPARVRGAPRGHGHARGSLPRHVRHRVHDREAQVLAPADAHRQADRVRRVGDGLRHAGGRADRRRRGAAPRGREPPGGAVQAAGRRRGVCRAGDRADRRRASTRRRARRAARSCSAPTRRRSGPAAAST